MPDGDLPTLNCNAQHHTVFSTGALRGGNKQGALLTTCGNYAVPVSENEGGSW